MIVKTFYKFVIDLKPGTTREQSQEFYDRIKDDPVIGTIVGYSGTPQEEETHGRD